MTIPTTIRRWLRNRKPRIGSSKSVKALFINDPHERLDDEHAFRASRRLPIPRDASFTENGKTKPILIYALDETDLPEAEGQIRWGKGRTWSSLETGWRYLTTYHVYQNQDQDSSKLYDKPIDFVNAIAEGNVWESPERMGPYQFGAVLMLKPLKRRLTKIKRLEAAVRLEKSVKAMLFAVVAAAVFVLILQSN